MSGAGKAIRVGIGGWTFKPWRNGAFYPKGWPQGRELAYGSRSPIEKTVARKKAYPPESGDFTGLP